MKLPKQWRHWCQSSGLYVNRTLGGQRKEYSWFYLKGHGYVWRLNCNDEFEIGDRIQDFDRWALCEINRLPMPHSLKEFKWTVKTLRKLAGLRGFP